MGNRMQAEWAGINSPLTLREVMDGPEWSPVVRSYEQYSQLAGFDSYFERPRSIHGVKHAWRVLFHTLMICELCALPAPDRELLISAALYHDIGRDNDGLCYVHGKRSVEKMAALNLAPTDPTDFAALKFMVTYHCIDDHQAKADLAKVDAGARERTWRLCSVLKDADGLDRVRINDLDVKYLRNPQSTRLAGLAWELLKQI